MLIPTRTSTLDVSHATLDGEPVVRVRIGPKGHPGSLKAHLTIVQAMALARVLLQIAIDESDR